MREIKFEEGEEVFIKVVVTGIKIAKDKNMYYLKNPQTGRPFEFMFEEDKLFPVEDK